MGYSCLGGIDLIYKGIVFNDPMYKKFEDGDYFWSDICQDCLKKYEKELVDISINDGSSGVAYCLVEGCSQTEEEFDDKIENGEDTGVVYIDFRPENMKDIELRDRKTKKLISIADLADYLKD